jgi:hypothetical protein
VLLIGVYLRSSAAMNFFSRQKEKRRAIFMSAP